jgi:hypothetical protein
VDDDVPAPAAAAQSCGTWAGYKRHKRRGEDPCELCREARRARGRAHYHQHRERYLANARRRYDEVLVPERRRRALRQRACPSYSDEFETTNAQQRFCSAQCRQRASSRAEVAR